MDELARMDESIRQEERELDIEARCKPGYEREVELAYLSHERLVDVLQEELKTARSRREMRDIHEAIAGARKGLQKKLERLDEKYPASS
jgi:hypothetical protein